MKVLPEKCASFSRNLAGVNLERSADLSMCMGQTRLLLLWEESQLLRNLVKCASSLQNLAGVNMAITANMGILEQPPMLFHVKLAIFSPNLAGASGVIAASMNTSKGRMYNLHLRSLTSLTSWTSLTSLAEKNVASFIPKLDGVSLVTIADFNTALTLLKLLSQRSLERFASSSQSLAGANMQTSASMNMWANLETMSLPLVL
mmetsp:Transcript_84336/g.103347  ORF Transcript_84336/g.103347 Transcript_84336/m.103347 type:complete len:203 (+) Transcript_84336:147-755(+)